MSNYTVHTIQSAPEQSKPVLEQLHAAFGRVPNIAGTMANSPVLISGFIGLFQRVHASSLTEPQIQTLLLTNAVTNRSAWAVAFHTALSLQEGVSESDVDAMRHGRSPHDASLGALSTLARTLIEQRGHLDDAQRARFTGAGFSDEQVLEVIAVVAASTITNYTGSVTQPPLEAPFDAYAWHGA